VNTLSALAEIAMRESEKVRGGHLRIRPFHLPNSTESLLSKTKIKEQLKAYSFCIRRSLSPETSAGLTVPLNIRVLLFYFLLLLYLVFSGQSQCPNQYTTSAPRSYRHWPRRLSMQKRQPTVRFPFSFLYLFADFMCDWIYTGSLPFLYGHNPSQELFLPKPPPPPSPICCWIPLKYFLIYNKRVIESFFSGTYHLFL
jgi:hypothetical protein